MLWRGLNDENAVRRQPRDITISKIVQANEAPILELEGRTFTKEKEMYEPVIQCLEPIFEKCKKIGTFGPAKVYNSHGSRTLGGLAPDISICRGPLTAYTICAFVEMKVSYPFSDEWYGQCMDYLYQMRRHQPGRKYYVGMLSSIEKSTILVLTYRRNHQQSRSSPERSLEDSVPQILLYDDLDFRVALSRLLSLVGTAEYNPPELGFSKDVGALHHVLGAPRRAALGVFNCPQNYKPWKEVDRGQLMAVKVTRSKMDKGHINEADILETFAVDEDLPFSVPLIVHNSLKHREIGIMPVGVPFRMRQLKTQAETRSCLQDILSALEWIHDRGIVHRDVRLDNLILVPKDTLTIDETAYDAPQPEFESEPGRPRAVLIDFDRAALLNRETDFEGGYVCCPPSLLKRIAERDLSESVAELSLTDSMGGLKYQPKKSDDYLSFVLVVLTLLIPHCFETFDYAQIGHAKSDEFRRLMDLWEGLESSSMWGPMVEAAQGSEVEQLEKILEVFVML
jgi:serine/threonine protein kinase